MGAQVLASSQQYRFAFDIGGTFTDLVLLGSEGTIFTSKVLTGAPDVVSFSRDTGGLRGVGVTTSDDDLTFFTVERFDRHAKRVDLALLVVGDLHHVTR